MKKIILITLAFLLVTSYSYAYLAKSNFTSGTIAASNILSNAEGDDATFDVTLTNNSNDFPNASAVITIFSSACSNAASCASREIVKIKASSCTGSHPTRVCTLTVNARNQESTTHSGDWGTGSKVSLNITVGNITELETAIDGKLSSALTYGYIWQGNSSGVATAVNGLRISYFYDGIVFKNIEASTYGILFDTSLIGTSNKTVTWPDSTGTVCLDTGSGCGTSENGMPAEVDHSTIIGSGSAWVAKIIPHALYGITYDQSTDSFGALTYGQYMDYGGTPHIANNACGGVTQGVLTGHSYDYHGVVTGGTTGVTTCTVTFGGTYANALGCIAQVSDGTVLTEVTPTNTTLTMTAADLTSKIITYRCFPKETGGTAASGDSTPPTLLSATIASSGNSILLQNDETVTRASETGWTLNMSGGASAMTYSSGSGSNTLVYTLARTIHYDETGTIDWTAQSNTIEDLSGNDLASETGKIVTNNSTYMLKACATCPSAGDGGDIACEDFDNSGIPTCSWTNVTTNCVSGYPKSESFNGSLSCLDKGLFAGAIKNNTAGNCYAIFDAGSAKNNGYLQLYTNVIEAGVSTPSRNLSVGSSTDCSGYIFALEQDRINATTFHFRIRYKNTGGTFVDSTGSTVFTEGVWYQIGITYSETTGTLTLKIDNSTEVTITDLHQSTTARYFCRGGGSDTSAGQYIQYDNMKWDSDVEPSACP